MSNKDEIISLLKMICNTNRLEIINLLLRQSKEEVCVSQIAAAVGISQSLASHQLAYLEARGVVVSSRSGQTICYELSNAQITKKVLKVIKSLN